MVKGQHFVVFPDLAHSVLLSADYVLPKLLRAKLEKAVGFAELQGTLDVHAPLLVAVVLIVPVAAPDEVFGNVTLVFAILVAAPQTSFGDVTLVFKILVAAPDEVFGNVTLVFAILVAPQTSFDDVALLVAMPLAEAPTAFDTPVVVAEVPIVFDAPVLAFVLALVVTVFADDDDALAVDALATAAVVVATSWNVLVLVLAELANISGPLSHVEN